MKAIKITFAILFVSSMFISCESDSINEEVGIEEEIEVFGTEDGEEDVDQVTYGL